MSISVGLRSKGVAGDTEIDIRNLPHNGTHITVPFGVQMTPLLPGVVWVFVDILFLNPFAVRDTKRKSIIFLSLVK